MTVFLTKLNAGLNSGRGLRILCVLAAIAIIADICSSIVINRNFTVTFYQIRSEKVSDNIRIIELADLHNKQYGEKNIKLVDKIKSLHPDLIIFAGDMMNYKDSDYSVLFDLSDKLSKIAPVEGTIMPSIDGKTHEGVGVTTTYDKLLEEYVAITQTIKTDEIDKEYSEYIRNIFLENPDNEVLSNDLDNSIESLVQKLGNTYALVRDTAIELNEFMGAKHLTVLNSIATSQKVNIKIYLVLALILFLFIGCAGAIVVGRISDFIQYILYTDKKTKLPNRQMCDMYIDNLAEKVLEDECTCIVVKLKMLNELNEKVGHSAGDMLLSDFGRILRFTSKNYGFVGYNGVGQFIGIFEQCTVPKAELFIEQLGKNIKEYNEKHVEVHIKCSVAFANSTDDKIYDIRSLIRRAFKRMK